MYAAKERRIGVITNPKVGTRTITALCALSYLPTLLDDKPEWFNPNETQFKGNYPWLVRTLANLQKSYEEPVSDNLDDYQYKFAITRDPVERFLSGYRNRVMFHRDMEGNADPPTLRQFVKSFDMYMDRHPNLAVHFKPQINQIGTDLKKYTRVFDLGDMPLVHEAFSEVYGFLFPQIWLQQGGRNFDVRVTDDVVNWIRERYRCDYEVLYPDKL